MKEKVFFNIFKGLLVGKNCLRPETAPLTLLVIEGGLSWDFEKTLKTTILWDIVARVC